MLLVDFSFVIQESVTEIECVHIEGRVRRKSLRKKEKELEDKVVFLRSKNVSCIETNSLWPTVSAVERSSMTKEKITSATFNDNPLFSVTFTLNNGSSETVHLGAPNLDELNNKIHITIDDDGYYENKQPNTTKSTQLNEVQGVEKSQNYADLQSDKYTDSDEEIEEQVSDELTLSLCQECADEVIRNVPSDLSEDLLPSINDIMEIDIEINLIQSEIDSRNVANVLNSSQIRKDELPNIEKYQLFVNDSYLNIYLHDIIKGNERTSIINEKAKEKQKANESIIINVPSNLSSVYINDPIPEFYIDKVEKLRTSNDSINILESDDSNSEEEIEKQGVLARKHKHKINQKYEISKKPKTTDSKDEVITFQNINENSQLANILDKLNLDDFLTTNFKDLFDKNDIEINISFQSSLEYLTSIEKLEGYLKEWIFQFDQITSLKYKVDEKRLKMLYDLKKAYISLIIMLNAKYEQNINKPPSHYTLCGFVYKKMQSILNIKERQKRKYWLGTWRLIELFNLTCCPTNIMVGAGITAKFLMNSIVENYDLFLKSLLDDNDASHQSPKFDSSVIK
ncbi:14068_t:CDS:10 [Cetraspora pellucida]|uniref:14068_t:CDS:1 n=1 Tax=Cetraspora pellucida TaxID=1433469 RepID=A0A9N8ZBA3_9GLOM|nr:14068_t:CDS:10 [Cetraspora pellucida]